MKRLSDISLKTTLIGTALLLLVSLFAFSLWMQWLADRKTSALVQGIAAVGEEQAEGIGRIGNSMGQINANTQQNSAVSEEMRGQAIQLQESMEFFKVGDAEVVPSRKDRHGGR